MIPQHVGIIMDGNRRWAKKRLLPVAMGHKKGAEVFRERVRDLSAAGVKHATFYALSTENLNREKGEVNNLVRLFESQLDDLEKIVNDENIRVLFIGDLSVFPDSLREKIAKTQRGSAERTGMTCRIAVNYGAKAEIVRAVGKAASSLNRKTFTEQEFSELLYTKDAPDVDLIIRTGGEKRLSNFLLWQAAYAELYFTDILWCDFSGEELTKALDDYAGRIRRLGK